MQQSIMTSQIFKFADFAKNRNLFIPINNFYSNRKINSLYIKGS